MIDYVIMAGVTISSSEEFVNSLIAHSFVEAQKKLGTDELVKSLISNIFLDRDICTIVSLVGGAASGKSTLAGLMIKRLQRQGWAADSISTDDYVIGDRIYRREHLEGREPRAKYDFNLLNMKIAQIRNNRNSKLKIAVPTYDEANGIAVAAGEEKFIHKIGKVDVLIIEGDFYEVTDPDLAIFLDVSDEQRLRSRVARDVEHRNEADTSKIVENFHIRQAAQHLPYTLPAAEHADLIVRGNFVGKRWSYDVFRVKTSEPS